MIKTPFIRRSFAAVRNVAIGTGLLILFFIGMDLLRSFRMLWDINPLVAASFVLVVVIAGLWATARLIGNAADRRALRPPPAPEEGAVDHRELVDYCKYLMLYLKRLSDNALLTADEQKRVRQQAYNIEEVLAQHPLNNDLMRAINKTGSDVIQPTQALLRAHADTFARERMRAVVEDVIEPPFPVINPFVVFYIQVTLISRIADIYYPRLLLIDYFRIMRDVFRVVTEGRFFKLGQNLFAGVYANSPPIGRAIIDVGQSLTCIWLTRVVSRAAIMRCEALCEWDVDYFIQEMEEQVVELLADTKDCFLIDAMPTLRLRIRHSAPLNIVDAAGFSTSIADGIAKAIDAVVKGYQSQPLEWAIVTARKTQPGVEPPAAEEPAEAPHRHRRRRRSHRPAGRGVFRIFHTFGQRIKYSVTAGRLHK